MNTVYVAARIRVKEIRSLEDGFCILFKGLTETGSTSQPHKRMNVVAIAQSKRYMVVFPNCTASTWFAYCLI